jgi:hypothetical protein
MPIACRNDAHFERLPCLYQYFRTELCWRESPPGNPYLYPTCRSVEAGHTSSIPSSTPPSLGQCATAVRGRCPTRCHRHGSCRPSAEAFRLPPGSGLARPATAFWPARPGPTRPGAAAPARLPRGRRPRGPGPADGPPGPAQWSPRRSSRPPPPAWLPMRPGPRRHRAHARRPSGQPRPRPGIPAPVVGDDPAGSGQITDQGPPRGGGRSGRGDQQDRRAVAPLLVVEAAPRALMTPIASPSLVSRTHRWCRGLAH